MVSFSLANFSQVSKLIDTLLCCKPNSHRIHTMACGFHMQISQVSRIYRKYLTSNAFPVLYFRCVRLQKLDECCSFFIVSVSVRQDGVLLIILSDFQRTTSLYIVAGAEIWLLPTISRGEIIDQKYHLKTERTYYHNGQTFVVERNCQCIFFQFHRGICERQTFWFIFFNTANNSNIFSVNEAKRTFFINFSILNGY